MKVSAPIPARRFPALLTASSAALLMGWCGSCLAQEDEALPLFLTTSLTLMHDSNLARTPERQSDTVRAAALAAGLSKSYGRQTYLLYGRLTKNQYNRFAELLDNDGKNMNGKVTSEFMSNWLVTLAGQYDENLNSLQDNVVIGNSVQSQVIRNIRRYRDTNLSVQYGKSGLWSVVGKLDKNDLAYSEQREQNADQTSQSLRVYYSPSDLLRFGVGPRFVKTEYPNRTTATSRKVEDSNLDFTTDWRVSGLSSLNALLSLRDTKYTDANGQSTSKGSTTGSLGWVFTPRGSVSYSANLSRRTNSDRANGGLGGLASITTDYITNTVSLGANWQASAKIKVGANYTRNMYDSSRTVNYSQAQLASRNSADSTDSHQDTYSLDVQYQLMRSVELGCNLAKYNQTRGIGRNEYDGHSTSCSASLTLD